MKPSEQKKTRSKLETHVDTLKVLAQTGPSKLTQISNRANVNNSVLRTDLEFLIKQGLIEEQAIKKQSGFFAITQRGINVLKYFHEIPQILPSVEAHNK